jgi:hypothetical protein
MGQQPAGGETKKLIGAAQYWAKGERLPVQPEEAAALGVILPEQPVEHFEVMPEAWAAVTMFLRCSTQWRTSMAGIIGLDYAALQWLFTLHPPDDPAALLADIQIMESAAIEVINKEAG